jgi:glycosyltransferase involved in cell wall biosynthesis
MASLRVVYLDHCARLSGAELALLRVLPALSEVDKHVILGEDGPFSAALKGRDFSTEVLPLGPSARNLRKERASIRGVSGLALLASARYVRVLARRLRVLKPDLIHTNTLKAAVYGLAAARIVRIPAICHLRDRIDSDYLPPMAVRTLRVYIPRMCDAVIANSATTLATLHVRNAGLLRPVVPSFVIYDPYDPNLSPEGRPHEARPFTIAFVGRMAPWKGQLLFVEAFARAFGGGDAIGLIVGAALFGEDKYEQEVRCRIDTLGLSERLKMLGFRDDVPQILRQVDCLVHASILPEPFGQVVLEGMAQGLPVIASNAGGPAELVIDGQTGLLTAPGDIMALARAMRRLADDPILRQNLGASARTAVAPLTPDTISAQITQVYREVLKKRVQRHAIPESPASSDP